MNPEHEFKKLNENGKGAFNMREIATTVFKALDNGSYELIKTRCGDLVYGGIYSYKFVKTYARNNEDVYIEQ